MEWNGNKVNEFFFFLYNRLKPERFKSKPQNALYINLHDQELGLQDLYSRCAKNAWTKEGLLDFLGSLNHQSIAEQAKRDAKDVKKYTEDYMKEAIRLKEGIEAKGMAFFNRTPLPNS